MLEAFFIGPWQGAWFFGNTLDGIALLLTAATGVFIAFRGGYFNLGSEGQVYLGGIAASCVILFAEISNKALLLIIAAFAAMLTGSVMAGLSGVLKRYCGAHEVISSFLLSSALKPVGDYVINSFLRDGGNLLASPPFSATLPLLLSPSHLSISFIISIFIVCIASLFINKTALGYRFRVAGSDITFANYGAIDASSYCVPSLAVSGALCALSGFFAVAGTYGRCHIGFSGSLGWNALAVALIAGSRPFALFPAAFFYGALKAGSESALLTKGIQMDSASFIQGFVLLAAAFFFRGKKHD